jgi:hypothetical protein
VAEIEHAQQEGQAELGASESDEPAKRSDDCAADERRQWTFLSLFREHRRTANCTKDAQNTAVTEVCMKPFIEEANRSPAIILRECLEDSIHLDNPLRALDAFVEPFELADLGFEGEKWFHEFYNERRPVKWCSAGQAA